MSRPDPRPRVLGYPLDPLSIDAAAEAVVAWTRQPHGARTVVTLNPEIVVRAQRDAALDAAIRAADLCVADGVGVAWAAKRAGLRVPERVPGIDLAARVLERAGSDLPTFLLGAKPGVAERAATRLRARYGTDVVGVRDGYFGSEENAQVAAQVAAAGARLLLAGLGDRQEAFLHEQRGTLGALVAIGVGGSLDVWSGEARRTPAWTQRLGIEWAWRVGLDPKRWHRAPRLARFVALVLRHGRG